MRTHGHPSPHETQNNRLKLGRQVDHVSLSVADLDRQRTFYATALGMTDVEEELAIPEAAVRTAILRSPSGLKIELIERGGSATKEYADAFDAANDQSYGHWAVMVEDLETAFNAVIANEHQRSQNQPQAHALAPGLPM